LRLDYVTTVNDPACQFQDQITGMSVAQRESRYERPVIDGGSHSLRVVTSWSGRLHECAWRPAAVFICAGPRSAADADLNCRSLMLLTASGSSPRRHVSLRCPPPSWYCLSADGKDPTEHVSAIAGSVTIDLASELRPVKSDLDLDGKSRWPTKAAATGGVLLAEGAKGEPVCNLTRVRVTVDQEPRAFVGWGEAL
jgi:hypothetical protein